MLKTEHVQALYSSSYHMAITQRKLLENVEAGKRVRNNIDSFDDKTPKTTELDSREGLLGVLSGVCK